MAQKKSKQDGGEKGGTEDRRQIARALDCLVRKGMQAHSQRAVARDPNLNNNKKESVSSDSV